MFIQQDNVHGSVITECWVSLHGEKKIDWSIKLEGNRFNFPFDWYTAVLHIRGTEIFFPDGELLDFKYTVFTGWDPKDWILERDGSIKKTQDLKATVTIYFWRPWCLWLSALLFLGIGGVFTLPGAWLYRGSWQEIFAILSFPITCLALREKVFDQGLSPTIFDVVWSATFFICVLIFFFAPVEHPRIQTRKRRS